MLEYLNKCIPTWHELTYNQLGTFVENNDWICWPDKLSKLNMQIVVMFTIKSARMTINQGIKIAEMIQKHSEFKSTVTIFMHTAKNRRNKKMNDMVFCTSCSNSSSCSEQNSGDKFLYLLPEHKSIDTLGVMAL